MRRKLLILILFLCSSTWGIGQAISNFHFFAGDTLDGFDIPACQQEALRASCGKTEVPSYIRAKEKAFVLAKYHLPNLVKPLLHVKSMLTSTCNNTDFESGNFSGWVGAVGYNNNSLGPLSILSNGISTTGMNAPETSCSDHTLLTSASGNDPYSGLPMLDPGGGTYAVRLGGENVNIQANSPCVTGNSSGFLGCGGELLQQTFVVTPSNALFTYNYAVVMTASPHAAGQEPYFRIEVLDSNGNANSVCEQFYVEGDSLGPPKGFKLSPVQANLTGGAGLSSVYYLPWTSNSINLFSYLGHTITVRFTAAGCVNSVHFCYAYIDATCGAVQSGIKGSPQVCLGQTDTLIGPGTGGLGTYQWHTKPAGTAGIVGSALNQSVVINAPGTYEVVITYPGGCSYKIDTTLTFRPLPVIASSPNGVSCNGFNNGSITVTPSGSTAPYTYSWSPAPGAGQGTATASGLPPGSYTVHVTGSSGCTSTKVIPITQPVVLAATNIPANISCFNGTNGSVSATVSGGTAAYTYSWSPSGGAAAIASGLGAGTYTCTITDAHGCVTTTKATLTQPPTLPSSSNAKTTMVSCFGTSTGSDSIAASGGTPGYVFSWSPSGGAAAKATGLSAGTYTCTVTDSKGCITSSKIIITQPALLTATNTTTTVSCFGKSDGADSVTAKGGTAAYTYSWSPVAGNGSKLSGLPAGTYTCSVTDAQGCKTNDVISITQPAILAATGKVTAVSCFAGNNGADTVSVTGGTTNYTFSWTPSGGTAAKASGLTAGTYTCSVTDAKGCTTTTLATIVQPTILATTNVPTNVFCFAGTNGSDVVTASGGTAAYQYTWSPSGGAAATAIGLTAGVYTCTVTDAHACKTNAVVNITQPTLLSATNSITSVSCFSGKTGSDSAIVIGGVPAYAYSWTPSGGTGVKETGLGIGTYTCTITDLHNCKTSFNVTITQPPAILVASSSIPTPCGGHTGSASVSPTGGSGAFTYSWSPVGGAAATLNVVTSGIFTCTVTDAKGCTKTTAVAVSNTGGPNGSIVSTTNVSCFGSTDGTATATGSGGTGTLTYSWSPVGGSGTAATTATNLPPGTYFVSVMDAAGCQKILADTILEPAKIAATVVVTNVSCFNGSNGTAALTTTGGNPGYFYTWSPLGGSGATGTGLTQGIFTCAISDTKGCTGSATATITQPATALAGASLPVSTSCFGGSNGSDTVTASGGTAPYTFSWFPVGGAGPKATGLPAGTYSCTITDSKGCIQVTVSAVTQPTAVAAVNTPTGVSCFGGTNGSSTVVPSGGTAGYSYSWSPVGGTGATATGVPAGTYTCLVTDSKACTFSSVVIITQPVVLTATSSTKPALCHGGSTGSDSVAASGGTSAYTYSWFPSGGNGAKAAGLQTGQYTCTITDAHGCSTTSVAFVTEPTAITATIPPANVSCFGGTNGADSVFAAGGTGAFTYSWSPSGGSGSKATGLSAGIYTCTIMDANGCIQTQTIGITQNAAITSPPGTTPAICTAINGTATMTPSGGAGPYSYSWSPLGGTGASATALAPGNYTCTITDNLGCKGVVGVTVLHSTGNLNAAFHPNTLTGFAPLGVSFTDVSGGTPNSWNWNFGNGAAGSVIQNPGSLYSVPGTYTVTEVVTDANGCIDSTKEVILVLEPSSLSAPNVFTPNGDGVNDEYKVFAVNIELFNMKIYDRWGVLLYELPVAGQSWDGRTKTGMPVSSGTYYYIISATGLDNRVYNLQGFIMLIR
jgi:gliding motility-associated-like protein